jgi:predicted GIY-YIG superfamily endonuclease
VTFLTIGANYFALMALRVAWPKAQRAMWYVYIIRSTSTPNQDYTGATADLKRRLADHNAGKSTHTAKFTPWKLAWYCAFPDKHKALDFEKYLKSHSGRAFAMKRLLNCSPVHLSAKTTQENAP